MTEACISGSNQISNHSKDNSNKRPPKYENNVPPDAARTEYNSAIRQITNLRYTITFSANSQRTTDDVVGRGARPELVHGGKLDDGWREHTAGVR
jgi:hypothetical protein